MELFIEIQYSELPEYFDYLYAFSTPYWWIHYYKVYYGTFDYCLPSFIAIFFVQNIEKKLRKSRKRWNKGFDWLSLYELWTRKIIGPDLHYVVFVQKTSLCNYNWLDWQCCLSNAFGYLQQYCIARLFSDLGSYGGWSLWFSRNFQWVCALFILLHDVSVHRLRFNTGGQIHIRHRFPIYFICRFGYKWNNAFIWNFKNDIQKLQAFLGTSEIKEVKRSREESKVD